MRRFVLFVLLALVLACASGCLGSGRERFGNLHNF